MSSFVRLAVCGLGVSLVLGACASVHSQGQVAASSDEVSAQSVVASPLIESVTVSNLVDEASRGLLRDSLRSAGVPQADIDVFLDGVVLYNSTVKELSLIPQGFVPLSEVSYDLGKMTQMWDQVHPDYVGQNCRISAFQLAHSVMSVQPAQPDVQSLFVDKDALGSAPEPLLSGGAVSQFEGFFGRVATDATKDQQVHVGKMKDHFAAQGVVFPQDLQILSIVMHDVLDESPYLFVGHVGVLVRAADGEGFLFIEKLAFDEPFQVLRVKDALQASDVLMSRYDVEYGQENARPFVMANGDLLPGFRGNPNNPEELN